MKIGLLGDLHLNSMAPRRRLDSNYLETQIGKLTQAYIIFRDQGCDIALQPGDYFDSCTVANRTKAAAQAQIRDSGFWGRVYCVWGQHDVSSHSAATVPNSPLTVLASGKAVHVLGSEPIVVEPEPQGGPGGSPAVGLPVALYGAPFGQDIPVPESKNFCNILVAHIMVGDRPLWPGQELPSPKRLLKLHPGYDLIFVGDYHYRFSAEVDGRMIVNMGALMRKTTASHDLTHEPACGVFDTVSGKLETFKLDVVPSAEIFDFTEDVVANDNAILADLVAKLSGSDIQLCNWKSILVSVLDEMEATESQRMYIDKAFEEIKKHG